MPTLASEHAGHRSPPSRFRLPVSGLAARLRAPTGGDDLVLLEGGVEDPALALALAERLASTEPAVAWSDLPVTDVDAVIVQLRRLVVGDRVTADVVCSAEACGQRVDLSFSLGDYLAHHRPARQDRRWAVSDADEHGWRRIDGLAGSFRLPTLADQIAVYGADDPAAALAVRCIRPQDAPRPVRARMEGAMRRLAPPLSGPLEGRCPACGAAINARFEARDYCLRELRDRARFVYDDIDALAERYHWSEREILRLPHVRRVRYAERARQAQGG
jgi:hypothetical protein